MVQVLAAFACSPKFGLGPPRDLLVSEAHEGMAFQESSVPGPWIWVSVRVDWEWRAC